jgi:hypothetical protein
MLTTAAANSFLDTLAMPEPREYASLTETVARAASEFPQAMRAPQQPSAQSAQVNAGSLTSFVQGLGTQDKEDVMNSTLLAQLAANKAFDRFQRPLDWAKFYSNVLQNTGWNMPTFAFDDYTSGGTTVNMDKAVLGILGAIATGNEIAVVAATMEALKSQSAGSKPINIWNANASGGNAGNFQILPCASVSGTVVMIMVAMQFAARTSHGGFLWWTWSSTDINIKRAAYRIELNANLYQDLRAKVKTKLGDRAASFIDDLSI